MRALVQSVRTGDLRLIELPTAHVGPTQVAVTTTCSVVSAGTERAVRRLASSGLVGKARARPDLVRQLIAKARSDGMRKTVRAVTNRLAEDMPLGYSASGVVTEVGAVAAPGVVPGQRVATAGAGHAEQQLVPANLVAPIPDPVSDEDAAFSAIGAIALHAFRLAKTGPGAQVCVIGLGLVGALAARVCLASGLDVVGLDVDPWKVEQVGGGYLGLLDDGPDTTAAVLEWTKGRGVDAVLVAAASPSSEPLRRAPALCRDRATIVVVGDVGMELDRRPLYDKELTLRVSRGYGPGRHDRSYEEWGVDYPPGQVRWTEGRNLEAFLDLLARNRLAVADLVTHRLPFDEAAEAYRVLDGDEHHLAITLRYEPAPTTPASTVVPMRAVDPDRGGTRSDGIGLVGAGNYARTTLIPALRAAGFERLVSISSATGLTARTVGDRAGFERVVGSIDDMLDDTGIGTILIATPHSTHAELTVRALSAGRHVFCEKPLALSEGELDRIVTAWRDGSSQLAVGLNRRHSPAIAAAKDALEQGSGPMVISYRVSAESLAPSHWYHDRTEGGRLLGEVCHFIDTCNALVQLDPVSVVALASGRDELLLSDDLAVSLRYPDGSLATIAYASGGHSATAKERVEILGRGHTVVIDDYRACVVDGRRAWKGTQDKGHVELLRRFRRAVTSGSSGADDLTQPAIAASVATLAAAASLVTGMPEPPRSFP